MWWYHVGFVCDHCQILVRHSRGVQILCWKCCSLHSESRTPWLWSASPQPTSFSSPSSHCGPDPPWPPCPPFGPWWRSRIAESLEDFWRNLSSADFRDGWTIWASCHLAYSLAENTGPACSFCTTSGCQTCTGGRSPRLAAQGLPKSQQGSQLDLTNSCCKYLRCLSCCWCNFWQINFCFHHQAYS